MKNKKLNLSVLLLGIGLTSLQAQVAIPATGGNASGSGGSASYSVGQVVYTTNTGTGGSVTQGVQQPYEIYTVGVEQEKGITLLYAAYPNPTSDNLTLKIDGAIPQKCIATLYDLNGKLLENKKVEGNETSISMENLAPAVYFLKVMQDNKEVKSFKIIKN